jgi:hypothetical protein
VTHCGGSSCRIIGICECKCPACREIRNIGNRKKSIEEAAGNLLHTPAEVVASWMEQIVDLVGFPFPWAIGAVRWHVEKTGRIGICAHSSSSTDAAPVVEAPSALTQDPKPIPMLLTCPNRDCGKRHIDEGEFATKNHHTHACQHCGMTWRPAIVPTTGVQFLPGFKS